MHDSAAGLRLSDRHTMVRTDDLQQASGIIATLQGAHTTRTRGAPNVHAEAVHVRAINCGHAAISTFKFGRHVDVVPHGLGDAILVTTAISGQAGLANRWGEHAVSVGETFIAHEEDSPVFAYWPETEVLKVRFQRTRFNDFQRRLSGIDGGQSLQFEHLLTAAHANERWVALLRFIVATLNAPQPQPQPLGALQQASMEEMLMMTLLSIQPSNGPSGAAAPRISPRQYRLAEEYIRQHLEADITLADIAGAAACSIRSLARAFQQAGAVPPMQYVHALRLQRIRTELAQAGPHAGTIADIAYRWGFRHLGEFNRKYRAVFGETPSATRSGARSCR